MTSTTLPKDVDAVFPGENWFFYWKTSASLWKSKLAQKAHLSKIVVPLNWSFHSETGDSYDFAKNRPETDLKKLVDIAEELGKEVIFLLPLTPVPYLPNGGVPHLLAKKAALSFRRLDYVAASSEGSIHKLYSFYDPYIFKSFAKYLMHLSNFFAEFGISSDVWGMNAGFMKDQIFHSYIEDYGKAFEQSFARFLDKKKSDHRKFSTEPLISTPQEEREYICEFREEIFNLYEESAKEALDANWEGTASVPFIGGSHDDFIGALTSTSSRGGFLRDTLAALSQDCLPSSVLLPHRSREGLLNRAFSDLITKSASNYIMHSSFYDEEDELHFAPLAFFHIYENSRSMAGDSSWLDLGLWDYLREHFKSVYKLFKDRPLKWDDNLDYQGKVFILQGQDLDKSQFHVMLKVFMSGGKVVLNRHGINLKFLKKLETFFLENSIQVERVHFQAMVHHARLGDGQLIIVEDEKLKSLAPAKQVNFWEKLLSTFSFQHLQIKTEDLNYYWRVRMVSPNELKFEEIRRVDLYNPTSYKKKLKIVLPKNFVVVKVIDESNCTVETHPHEINIDFLPEGAVSIDFGVFS